MRSTIALKRKAVPATLCRISCRAATRLSFRGLRRPLPSPRRTVFFIKHFAHRAFASAAVAFPGCSLVSQDHPYCDGHHTSVVGASVSSLSILFWADFVATARRRPTTPAPNPASGAHSSRAPEAASLLWAPSHLPAWPKRPRTRRGTHQPPRLLR
jgi:hypothetical protein